MDQNNIDDKKARPISEFRYRPNYKTKETQTIKQQHNKWLFNINQK